MAFPVNSVLDTFNRADGGLGSNWTAGVLGTESGTMSITSNQVGGSGSTGSSYWNVQTFGPDTEAYVTCPIRNDVNLYVRITSPGTGSASGYHVRMIFGNICRIFRLDNRVSTQLGSDISQSWTDGDSIGAEMIADTLTAYRKNAGAWATLGSRTDTAYTGAGYIGFTTLDPIDFEAKDDFGGGSIGGAPAVSVSRYYVAHGAYW